MRGRAEWASNRSASAGSVGVQDIAPVQPSRPARPIMTLDDDAEKTVLTYAGIVMDLASLRVKRDGRVIVLRPTEFRLLKMLLEKPERAFTRDQLKAGVWGHGVKVDPRSINTYFGRLRRALTDGGEVNVIRTITGYGYSLDATFNA